MRHTFTRFSSPFSCAAARGALVAHARRAVSQQVFDRRRRRAGRCRALADGKPDLQGVWGNNSVTPMTRPTQWKDKTTITDAEVDELKGLLAKSVDQGGDAIFGNLIQHGAEREGQGRVQADLVRPDHRQLQPVLDGRSRVGQPHVAHHRSAGRPVPAAHRRRRRPAAPPPPRVRAREALRMVPKIARCRSAAFRTARRARSRTTTATRRSSSRPTPSCCCRK